MIVCQHVCRINKIIELKNKKNKKKKKLYYASWGP